MLYFEFNLRLFLRLIFISTDCFCAIDLDTILPNFLASLIRQKIRVYDAHELFTELKEIVTRPAIHKLWSTVERLAVPQFRAGYTVNSYISDYFREKYQVSYAVVRNLPDFSPILHSSTNTNPFIIYQGAVNEGRCFETLIPAMKYINASLMVCGTGNYMEKLTKLIEIEALGQKIVLLGMITPEELKKITPTARVAVMLFEETGLNQYQSLANRFFDYIMAGVPQVCVDFPQYKKINDQYEVASLIIDTRSETIAAAINNLLDNDVYYNLLKENCLKARQALNWQNEEKVLLDFYEALFENKK